MRDALRIFGNLGRCIYDTYLQHVLRVFPVADKPVIFDAELYRVYEPLPPVWIPEAEQLAESTNRTCRERLQSLAARSRLMLGALAGTIFLMVAGSLYLYYRPPELPPKTAEMLRMKDADLLPLLRITRDGLETSIETYTREVDGRIAVFTGTGEALEFQNEQEFLDRLYPFDEIIQLQTYNDRVLRNRKFSDLHKAKILHRLYEENLLRVVLGDKDGPVLMTYNYLRRQLNKAELSRYMLYLMRHYAGTPVAIEAHFILSGVAEIQSRLVDRVFFSRDIRELCLSGKFEWHKFPNEVTAICDTRNKYLSSIASDSSKSELIFQNFQVAVLDRALKTNRTAYRRADLLFTKVLEKIRVATEPLAMQHAVHSLFLMEYPLADCGDIYRQEFLTMRNSTLKMAGDLRDLREQAELQARLDKLTHEAENLRSAIFKGIRTLNNIKAMETSVWIPGLTAQTKRRIEREEKLLPKKTEPKIQF
jgi:hypothetical protein